MILSLNSRLKIRIASYYIIDILNILKNIEKEIKKKQYWDLKYC